MKFWELKLGDTFKFKWEEDREWTYEKVGSDQVKCVKAPQTYSHIVNKIDFWSDKEQEVVLTKETVYIYLVEATEYGDDCPSYRVAFRNKNQAELHCSKLGKPYVFSEVREIELL